MSENYYLNTYLIGTMGYNGSPLDMAMLGYVYTIEITEEPETPTDQVDNIIGGASNPFENLTPTEIYSPYKVQTDKKKKYKIKVTAIIDGTEYVVEKQILDIKKPSVDNIKVSIDKDTEPKIKINILEE